MINLANRYLLETRHQKEVVTSNKILSIAIKSYYLRLYTRNDEVYMHII